MPITQGQVNITLDLVCNVIHSQNMNQVELVDPSKRSRSYVFTINNPTEEDLCRVEGLVESGTASYLVYGRECGESGTPHLQGCVAWSAAKSLSAAKRFLPRAYLASRKGSWADAIAYCKKDGDFTCFGEIKFTPN